jgi:hypothetical protein
MYRWHGAIEPWPNFTELVRETLIFRATANLPALTIAISNPSRQSAKHVETKEHVKITPHFEQLLDYFRDKEL